VFWKAFGLALLVMLTVLGVAGTVLFGVSYARKDTGPSLASIDATASARATASYEEGFNAGQAAANKCDVIVGTTGNFNSVANKSGDTVSKTLTIRSTKAGSTYTVQSPAVCVVNDAKNYCNDNTPGFAIGNPWPPACK
jgi:hypothetical protein